MPEYFLEQQPVRELVHDYPVSFFKEKKVSKVIPTGKKKRKNKKYDTTTEQWFYTRPHLIANAESRGIKYVLSGRPEKKYRTQNVLWRTVAANIQERRTSCSLTCRF